MTTPLNQVITGAVSAQLSGTLQMRGSAQMNYEFATRFTGRSEVRTYRRS